MEQNKFYQIKNVTEHEYTLVGCDGSVIIRPIQDVDKSALAFTIQDAKDGDVLASELCDSIILFRGIKDDNIDFYCDYDFSKIDIPGDRFTVNNGQHYGNVEDSKDFYPATKEQRDTLMKAMADAGYTFDFEKKELKKIEQKPATMSLDEAIEHCKEKSCGNSACALEHKQLAEWLKELKELRSQTTWKPSDEQMMAKATDVTVHVDAGGYPYIPQMELYDYDKDEPLANEGDKYKVILIKEE